MNVTVKPEFEKRIRDEVKAGRVSDAEEFVNKALYHYIVAKELGQDYAPEELDRLIAEGLDDIDRGDTIDGEAAFRSLRDFAAQRRRQSE